MAMEPAAEFPGMLSLESGFRAAVVGATGAIGGALAEALHRDPACAEVARIGRSSRDPARRIDLLDETSIEKAAQSADLIDILLVATGALRVESGGGLFEPEKSLSKLEPDALMAQMALNAVGPALVLKHFSRCFARRKRGLIGVLSARVGSIGDNRLGGWHGYRAAKAALNQLIRTSSIELRRTHPELVLAALHPGTVESPLSAPFRPEGAARRQVFATDASAGRLLQVLDSLTVEESGGFFDYARAPIPW